MNIFQGSHDVSVPESLVTDYFENLDAPSKQLVFFDHSGHNPWMTENEKFLAGVREAFPTDN